MADFGSLDVTGASLASLISNAPTDSQFSALTTSEPTSAIERAKIKNRVAQKRFRDRQKARSETLEAMLLLTTTELRQVQSKQEPLVKRIQMLETLITANSISSTAGPPSSTKQLMTDNPRMETTLDSRCTHLTCDELKHMDLADLVRLYSSYVHQLGILLVQASETPSREASNRLDQFSIETGSLLICMALSNPTAFKAMQSTRLDNFEEVSQPDSFFTGMLIATDLSVNQTDDILCIRRLFYRKLGQLARHRKALLSQLMQSQVDTCHASEKLTGLTDWGQRLHQNGMDEYCTWLQFALCLMRGVYTPRQTAISWVYAFPTMYRGNKLVDALAASNWEPTTQQLMEDTSVSDAQHALNWQHVIAYTHTVTPETVRRHLPFSPYFAMHARYSKQY